MIEAILQIPPPVGKVLRVCSVYHCNRLMYVKHILLHRLSVPLLDLIIMASYLCLLLNVLSMCISRSCTEMSLPSLSMHAHLSGYPRRLAKMWGHILASSYCSRKASTLKCQSVYITSAPGSVDLKIGISNLVGASCFLSLLPLQPLHLCQWPAVSLTVEYPSESGAPCLGKRGQAPSTDCSALGLWGPYMQSHCPHVGGEPCLSHLSHP